MSSSIIGDKLYAYIKLTRIGTIIYFFPHLVVLGILISRTYINLTTLLIIFADLLILLSAFVINDICDAEDDALDPSKINRNPISAGKISKLHAYIFLLILILISLVILIFTNFSIFIWGSLTLIIGLLYSIKSVRLKARPIIDITSHGFFLAMSQVISFSLVSGARFDLITVLSGFGVFTFSMGGDLLNEVRDWEVDRKVGLNNTASILGIKTSTKLITVFKNLGMILVIISIILSLLIR